jgi:hypothetical protein
VNPSQLGFKKGSNLLERFQTLPFVFQTRPAFRVQIFWKGLKQGSQRFRGFTKKGSNILKRFQTLSVFQTQQVFRGFTLERSSNPACFIISNPTGVYTVLKG